MKRNWIFFLIIGLMPVLSPAATNVRLTLDWKPEPEFGGFYERKRNGTFAKNDLDVTIKSAGEGAPTWQLVATGKTDFATTAADQVLIARARRGCGGVVRGVSNLSPGDHGPQGPRVHQD